MQSAVCVSIALLMFTAGAFAAVGDNCASTACTGNGEICENDACKLAVDSTGCTANGGECVANAACATVDSALTCTCSGGAFSDQSGYCRIPVDSTGCTPGNSNECVDGAVCETDTCKLAVGSSGCTANGGECVANAACATVDSALTCTCSGGAFSDQSGYCRIAVGGNGCTTGNTPQCVDGAECDSGTCKLSVGQGCDPDADKCVTGSKCDAGNGNTCRFSAGQGCDPDADKCFTGSTCDADNSDTCRLSVGQTCDTTADKCFTGSTCDGGNGDTCRLSVGQVCNTADDKCVSGSTCDADNGNTCKKSVGQTCTASQCVTDSVCEDSICRIKATKSCAGNTDGCVKGATCSSDTCACNTDISTQNVALQCAPKADNVGGSCTGTEGQKGSCTDPNALCTSSSCSCSTSGTATYVVDPSDLSCGLGVDGDCSSDSNLCIAGTVCESNVCKKAVGAACTGTGATSKCPANADCKSGKCACDNNYREQAGKCIKSAASGLAVSSVLMLLALITTRL